MLNFVTLGIFGIVWRAMLANRLKTNAARYGLKFSDSAVFTVLLSVLLPIAGLLITKIVLVKNFNQLAAAYNEYNGLVDEAEEKKTLFAD
jgi:hypothetical protein